MELNEIRKERKIFEGLLNLLLTDFKNKTKVKVKQIHIGYRCGGNPYKEEIETSVDLESI